MNHPNDFFGMPIIVPYVDPFCNPWDMDLMEDCVEYELNYMFRGAVPTWINLIPPHAFNPNDPARHFFTSSPSFTPVHDLVFDIHTSVRCSEWVVVCAMVILDRMEQKNPLLRITPYTCRRLVLAAIVVASKLALEHMPDDLRYYSEVGDFSDPNLMGILEISLLEILEWNVAITFEEYYLKMSSIMARMGFFYVLFAQPENFIPFAPPPLIEDESPPSTPPVTPPMSDVSDNED